MTTSKRDLVLPSRTPAYVDRNAGAAELMISPETWDRYVDAGILPRPALGFPTSTPRWRWADVDSKLVGKGLSDADAFIQNAPRLRNGPPKGARREAA